VTTALRIASGRLEGTWGWICDTLTSSRV